MTQNRGKRGNSDHPAVTFMVGIMYTGLNRAAIHNADGGDEVHRQREAPAGRELAEDPQKNAFLC